MHDVLNHHVLWPTYLKVVEEFPGIGYKDFERMFRLWNAEVMDGNFDKDGIEITFLVGCIEEELGDDSPVQCKICKRWTTIGEGFMAGSAGYICPECVSYMPSEDFFNRIYNAK